MKQKHENITLSFPADLNALLHLKISPRGISKYVADAVRKALDADSEKERLKLEAAYEEASKDKERQATVKEWESLDDKDIEGWEW